MKTADEQRIENIVGTVMSIIVGIVLIGVVALVLSLFWDMGQLDGYCKAVGGKVEDTVCVKDDVILKRGQDL